MNNTPLKPQQQQRLLYELCRNSLSAFTEKSFGIVSGADDYMHNWHVDLIAQKLEAVEHGDIKRLIINIPPRNMKSICATVAFPAWILGRNPHARIIAASYSNELSQKHSMDCKSVMESSFYKDVFPSVHFSKNKNTQSEYRTSKGGGRFSTSVGGSLTGIGGDYIIIDDPIKPDEALSETTRNNVNNWFDSTVYSRQNQRDSRIIIIMQRLHEDDLVGHVLGLEDWEHVIIPALAEERETIRITPNLIKPYKIIRELNDPLHAARHDYDDIQKFKAVNGSYNFAAQYQQRPAPLGGGLIKLDWFSEYYYLPDEKPKRIVQSWDTASKAGELNDYSVCTTWHQYENSFYLIDVHRRRYDFPDLKKAAIRLAEQHKPNAILVEDKNSGTQLIQDLKYDYGLYMIGINPEGDKIMRMNAQSAQIESGAVYIPEQARWRDDFLHEMAQFPNGKFDDQVDSVSQALGWMTQRKRIVRIS